VTKNKLDDPAFLHDRAVKAATARHQPEVYIRALARANLTDEHKRQLAELIASAPPLDEKTGEQIALLLRSPGGQQEDMAGDGDHDAA
jgi:hypothetical protein